MTIQTKYDIGDTVYWRTETDYGRGIVRDIRTFSNESRTIVYYCLDVLNKKDEWVASFSEDNVFPTKQELTKANRLK